MKKIICINPGHGGKDPGAVANEILEKDINLEISLYQKERFIELGWDVVMTREKDEYISLKEIVRIIKNSGAEICISNHCNSSSSNDAYGFEVIHKMSSDAKLANAIFNNIMRTKIVKLRRVYSRESTDYPGVDYYYILRNSDSVETLIIEYGFLSNNQDSKILTNEQERNKLAEAVIDSVCQFTGNPYKSSVSIGSESWKLSEIDKLAAEGLISDKEYWKERIEDGMPVWAVVSLINRLRSLNSDQSGNNVTSDQKNHHVK